MQSSARLNPWPPNHTLCESHSFTHSNSILVTGSFQVLNPAGTTWLKTMPLPPTQVCCMKTVYGKQSLDHWTPKMYLRIALKSTGWAGQAHAQDCSVHVLVFGNVCKLSPLLAATLLLKWLALAILVTSSLIWCLWKSVVRGSLTPMDFGPNTQISGVQIPLICRSMQVGKCQKGTFAPGRNQ